MSAENKISASNVNTLAEKEKEILCVKNYEVTLTVFKDGTSTMRRTNSGYNSLELLGLAGLLHREVSDQITGNLPAPDEIKREVDGSSVNDAMIKMNTETKNQ